MARARSQQRDDAKAAYLASGGKIKTKDLAAKIGVAETQIRKWKSLDKWTDAIKKKRGAPVGNKNAVGNGAPLRNDNAVTHGAYATIHLDSLSADDKQYVIQITEQDTQGKMFTELQLLMAKETDLKRRISELQKNDAGGLMYTDKVIEVLSAGKEVITTVKGTAFDRQLKLEAELNKVHGRIIKLLDSIKSYELETRRIDLDFRKYSLAKQRITGEFDIDDDTGEIIDDVDDEKPEK